MSITMETEELAALMHNIHRSHSMVIGEKYLVRTVTMYYTGRLESVTATDLVLRDAAWVADTGTFAKCLEEGTPRDVEPFVDKVIVVRDALVDIIPWEHELPRSIIHG